MAELFEVNDNNFQQEVLESKGLTLVHFMATWAGPCKMLKPILELISEEYAGRLLIYELNRDASPNIYSQYKIRIVPTLLLFKGGEVVKKIEGLQQESLIKQIIDIHI